MSIEKQAKQPTVDTTVEQEKQAFHLESDQAFIGFQKVEVTKVDDTKPWKPPVEVAVTLQDGSKKEGLEASTPFFTLRSADGKMNATVSAAAAGHIDGLHIKGTEPGSHFDYQSIDALLEDVSHKLKPEMLEGPGPSAFSVDMKRGMGKEGISSFDELKDQGFIGDEDIKAAVSARSEVAKLNMSGTADEKKAFVASFKAAYPDNSIQFQVLRDVVVLPIVNAPKQPTTKLFMVFGPDEKRPGQKTAWTMAPGRSMPRHPNPAQHMEKQPDGSMKLNEKTFQESSDAWFETVMLTGK